MLGVPGVIAGMRRDALWRMRVCVPLLLATACTHHYAVPTLLPTSAAVEATAQLVHDGEVELRAARTPDGIRWVQRTPHDDGGARAPAVIVDADAIRSYTTVSHGRGALEGLALGAASGIAAGVAIGLASGDDHCNSDSFCILQFSAGDKALIGAAVLGSIGLGLGAALGAVIGSRDVYERGSGAVPRMSAIVAPGRAGGALTWSF